MERRTRALAELLASAVTLFVSVRLWERLQERDDSLRISVPGLAAGALGQAVRLGLRDRDIAEIRTDRRRRVAAHLGWSGWRAVVRRSVSNPTSADHSFHLGALAATVVYRAWYGLLRPLPGPDG